MKTFTRQANQIIPAMVICAGISAVLAVIWCYVLYTVNIPYPDDYILSLEFLTKFDNPQPMADRISLLLQRYESHIMLLLRLTSLVDWKIFGALSFIHLIAVAFIFLLLMTVLLQSQCKGENRDLYATTVMLLCINALTYGTTLLPNNSQLNYPVLALNASAFLLLTKPGALRMCIAALMVTMATFSAGNGMFGFVCGAFVLAMRKDKKALFTWIAAGIIVVYIFIRVFETNKDYILATGLKLSIKGMAIYYLTFLGSIAQVIPVYGRHLAPLVGVMLLAACGFLILKKYYQKNAFITAWIFFMLITAAVVTAGRGGNVFSDALVPRYTINSCVLVTLIYLAFIELYENRIQRLHATALCFMALLFNVAALFTSLPAMAEHKTRLMAGAERYVTQADNSGFVSLHAERDLTILTEAANRNIYHMAAALGEEAPYKVPPAKILAVIPPKR